jgi:hypothetical protein
MMSAPVVAMSLAVTQQLRGDRVAVGLVVDQHAAEGVAGEWVEHLENVAEIGVSHSQPINPVGRDGVCERNRESARRSLGKPRHRR